MAKINPEISFVSPVYMAEHIIERLVSEINETMNHLGESYEIILIDDRSPDKSWDVMKQLMIKFSEVKIIRLSRNFGQHPAIMAGLSKAEGNWVVVMDCDLQDQPKEVAKLYNKALEGFDAVLAKRKQRNDSIFKRLLSRVFSKIYGFFTDTKYDYEVANFGIYNQKVVQSILQVSDYIKFFPLFVNFVGFNTTSVEVIHSSRQEGKSNYNLKKLISLAFNTIISFSNKPLKLFVKFGILISILAILSGFYTIYMFYKGEIKVLGYSSLIVSIWFLSGVIITTVGVSGIYIGKMFDQVKNRPVFIIDEILQQ